MKAFYAILLIVLAWSCTGDISPGVSPGSGGIGQGGGSGSSTGGVIFGLGGNYGGAPGSGSTSGSGGSCIDVDVSFEPTIPSVILLIDQSGSMNSSMSGSNRWNVVRDILVGPGGIVNTLEDDVRFGLMLYTGPQGRGSVPDTSSPCPLVTSVEPALGNHANFLDVYQEDDWLWETPTGESLQIATSSLKDLPGPKYIVLATDGEPDTCAVPNPQRGQDQTLYAISAAYHAGITTYVLSVGNEVSDRHLREAANLGQGLPVNSPENLFYRSNTRGELEEAFTEIIHGVRSCTLTLDGSVRPEYASFGLVTLNGVQLPKDTPDGWSLTAPNEIELLGTSCEAIRTGSHDISIRFPCGGIIVR